MTHSIMITSYECYGQGCELLKKNLESVFVQTYRPLQCIVSDHSKDDLIENMVKTLDHKDIDFIYVRYTEHYGNPCHNWINALKYATGETLQYMCMDDSLPRPDAIKDALELMKENNAKWMVCAHIFMPSNTVFIPEWTNDLLYGNNRLSGPGCTIISNDLKYVTFDPQFIWFLDVEWYYRLYKAAGHPYVCTKPTFVNVEHDNQMTKRVHTSDRRSAETELMYKKYGSPLPLCP